MTQRKLILALPFVSLLVAAVGLTGCSISGFTAGATADNPESEGEIIECSKIKSVRPGTALDVILKDGGTVAGQFLGMKTSTSRGTETSTAIPQSKDDALALPSLGHVVVDLKEESPIRRLEGTLTGFDPGVVLVNMKETNRQVAVPAALINTILDQNGVEVKGEILQSRMEAGKVVYKSLLVMKTENDFVHVDMNNVRFMRSDLRGNSRLPVGLFVGAAAEAVAVLLIARSMR